MLSAVAVTSCAFGPWKLTYPNPEPNETDETNLTPPRRDMAGPPRSCYYNIHFIRRGNITVMLAPQCVQVTITDEPSTGDPKQLRKAKTLIEPHEVTVVGDSDAQMDIGLSLQFPLRAQQNFIMEKPTMTIDPKNCDGVMGAGTAAACFN